MALGGHAQEPKFSAKINLYVGAFSCATIAPWQLAVDTCSMRFVIVTKVTAGSKPDVTNNSTAVQDRQIADTYETTCNC